MFQEKMQIPLSQEDCSLKETSPHLGNGNNERLGTKYDLVEQMLFLYVRVVKAKGLPSKGNNGGSSHFVEAKVGNLRGLTRNPGSEWNQVFTFSKDRNLPSVLEVMVRSKDFSKEEPVGLVLFDLNEIPERVPPDSPLAPQWYNLEDRRGNKVQGEVMLAVWIGTQADEAFPEAWHSDAGSISDEGMANLRSKVYVSPKLWYVRVNVIEAQELRPSDKTRFPEVFVKVVMGIQGLKTRISKNQSVNHMWNEDLILVAAEPFDDQVVISVEAKVGPNKDEVMGKVAISLHNVERRLDGRTLNSKWYNLEKNNGGGDDDTKKEKNKETNISSRIHLRICLDGGYHVLDESTNHSSDLRPTAKQLWGPSIGVLELGVLGAHGLLPMKTKDGRGATDAYCVAKYGQKWIRSRTVVDSLAPKWNEQYTWEVYEPCTVLTVGVFDNCHLQGGAAASARDNTIGKIRIRLSTLESDRVYMHSYPLLILSNGGLKKMGEIQLAIRFTCLSMLSMLQTYLQPLLPKMHYIHPLSVAQIELLRYHAMQIVSLRLARSEPPLRREAVEFMLDVGSHMWSMRRSKVNFFRIVSALSGLVASIKWFHGICNWKSPLMTVMIHLLLVILVVFPELILPTFFLNLFFIGIWRYRWKPRHPPYMDTKLSLADTVSLDELREEFDPFPTNQQPNVLKMRYDRLRSVAGRVQIVAGDLAAQGERMQALLSWRDPRATALFLIFCLLVAVVLYVTPMRVVALATGFYILRHPCLRQEPPSVFFNFFRRLPAQTDRLL